MKRYTILSLFILTLISPISAAVGDTFTNSDAKYANLVFTVLDEDAKTVSVKAANKTNYYKATDTLNIPDIVPNNETEIVYTVTEVATDGFNGIKIAHISFPSTIQHIHYQAFRSITTSFTCSLNEGLSIIGDRAFCQSTGLQGDLIIPSTVDSISTHVFYNCFNVDKLIIRNETPCKLQASVSFMNADGKTPITSKLYVPCGTLSTYRTTAVWNAFAWNSTCETVEDGIIYELLTDSTAIVSGRRGTLPTELIFKDSISIFGKNRAITEVKENVFNGATVSKIVLPKHLQVIGFQAFRSITSPFTLTLNEELKVIGNRAFCESTGLQGNLIIPSSVDSIYEFAFYNCSELTSIQVNTPSVPYLQGNSAFLVKSTSQPISDIQVLCSLGQQFRNNAAWNKFTIVDDCELIVDGIRYLKLSESEVKLLSYVDKNTIPANLVIPSSITSDATYAVVELSEKCFSDNQTITSLVIPTSVKTIGDRAFYQCKSMQSLTLSEGLETIGDRSFTRCVALESLTIPSTITSIYEAAFYDCTGLQTVAILAEEPPTIKAVVFQNISAPITIPCNSYVTYQKSAMWAALNLIDPCNANSFVLNSYLYSIIARSKNAAEPDTVSVDGYIGGDMNMDIASSIVYNEKKYIVKKIKDSAFRGNSKITTLHIPSSIDTVGSNAFNGCTALVNITIDEGVVCLDKQAFYGCSSAENISMGEGLLSIGDRCFAHCKKMTSFVLPATLKTIVDYAFFNCYSVEHYNLLSTVPPTLGGNNIFKVEAAEISQLERFYIPCGALDNYLSADYWKDYSSKFEEFCRPLKLTLGEALTKDTIVSSIAFSRTFPMNLWQELYLPFDVDSVLVLDEGEYYDINVPFDSTENAGYFYLYGLKSIDMTSHLITFQEVHKLEGFTPYLILFINKYTNYFEGKEVVFKTKVGEYTLTDNYSAPKLNSSYQLHGNTSLWEHSLTDGFTLSSSYEDGQYKFHFDYNESAPIHPFSWIVTPTKEIASKITLAPRFLAGRWGNQSSGGDVTTSMQNTSNNSLTYTQSGSQLTLHTQGQPCKVYAVDGTLLLSTNDAQDEVTIELSKGLYIIYSNGQSQKVLF